MNSAERQMSHDYRCAYIDCNAIPCFPYLKMRNVERWDHENIYSDQNQMIGIQGSSDKMASGRKLSGEWLPAAGAG